MRKLPATAYHHDEGEPVDSVQRVDQLDGLRGVAALIVVLHHCIMAFPGYDAAHLSTDMWLDPLALIKFSPLRLLVAGKAAVLLFFVLSGFVLSLAFLKYEKISATNYLLKRVTRLWPPFALAILIAAGLYAMLPIPPVGVSNWALDFSWNAPLTWWVLAKHLLMLGTDQNQMLDNPMWSLVHEMRIALIFPLLFAIVKIAPVRITAIFWILAIAGAFLINDRPHDYVHSYVNTGIYLSLFAAGITLATYRFELAAWLSRQNGWLRVALFLGSVFGLLLPSNQRIQMMAVAPAMTWLVAAAAFEPKVASILRLTPNQWLGKVSFSLYLIHLPVLLAFQRVFSGEKAPLWSALLGLPTALIAAELLFRLIEKPTIKFGRRFNLNAGRRPAELAATGHPE